MDSFTTFTFSATTPTVKADNMPRTLAAHEDVEIAASVPSDEERRTSGANCYCIVA